MEAWRQLCASVWHHPTHYLKRWVSLSVNWVVENHCGVVGCNTMVKMVCCCSVAQSCLTLHDPLDHSTPGFPMLHHLSEFAQTHVHWVTDVIQPSHPLSCPSPPAFNLSQHQDLFQWVSSSHQVAKILELWLQASVFPMDIQGWFPLGLTGLISLLSKEIFSNTTVQKYQLFGAQLS